MAKQNIIDATIDLIKLGKDATEVMDCCKSLLKPDLFQLVTNLAALVQSFPKEKSPLKDDVENAGNIVEEASQVTESTRKQVCKAFYNGQVCPDKDGCLSEHPKACDRPECKTRRSVDCTAWHTPLCKSFKRL
jgi:hypothetical protein